MTKQLFGLFNDKHNNYDDFVIKKISNEKQFLIDKQIAELTIYRKIRKIFIALRTSSLIFLILGIALFLYFIIEGIDKGFDFVLQKKFQLLILGIVPCVISLLVFASSLVIYFRFIKKNKDGVMNNVRNIIDICYHELGVPSGSPRIDIIRPQMQDEETLSNSLCYLFSYAVYRDEKYFYIASVQELMRFPLSYFVSCTLNNEESVLVPEWLKFESYQSKNYRNYFIYKEGRNIRIQRIYRITLKDDKDNYYIMNIPHYEEKIVESLISPIIEEY